MLANGSVLNTMSMDSFAENMEAARASKRLKRDPSEERPHYMEPVDDTPVASDELRMQRQRAIEGIQRQKKRSELAHTAHVHYDTANMYRLLFLLLLSEGAVAAVQALPAFNKLPVFPYPSKVLLPTPTGPLTLKSPNISVDPHCGGYITPLLTTALGLRVSYTDIPRTWPQAQYPEGSCGPSKSCRDDSDCIGTCFAQPGMRWNSTALCPPFGGACGCCIDNPQGLSEVRQIAVKCPGRNADEDESYTLDITQADGITISSNSSRGAAHGVSTLSQLLRWDNPTEQHYIDRVPVHITDAPKFKYRGLMIDTARHFIPVPELLQMVRGMHAAKLNILHWHIVDSTAFAYESKAYPELSAEGSWTRDASTIYSQKDVAAVMDFAAAHFVDVMLEFDTPAHTMAWGKSHPEVMTPCVDSWLMPQSTKGQDRIDQQAMDPTSPAAKKLVQSLLREAASVQTSKYMHIGGDEVKAPCWNSTASIRNKVISMYGDDSQESFLRLQADWAAQVSAATVIAADHTPIMWQPTGAVKPDPAFDQLPNQTVYMIWLSDEAVRGHANAGKPVIATASFYADLWAPGTLGSRSSQQDIYFDVDRWKAMYETKVIPTGLNQGAESLVLGGQLCIWAENVDGINLGTRSWQVGGAVAETLWSGPDPLARIGSDATGLPTERRIDQWLCHLRSRGVKAGPLLPSHCHVL